MLEKDLIKFIGGPYNWITLGLITSAKKYFALLTTYRHFHTDAIASYLKTTLLAYDESESD